MTRNRLCWALTTLASLLINCGSGGGGGGPDAGLNTGPDAGPVTVGTVTMSVGTAGGIVTLAGSQGPVALQIPAGALAATTKITVTEMTGGSLPGYNRYSSMFQFEPAGTTFVQPVAVSLPFAGDSSRATLFWSRVGTTGYDRIGGVPSGGVVTGHVTHFSSGFIADGIQYTDPPDKSCIIGRSLGGQEVQPSAVAMFFSIEDCQGRPITDLQTCESLDAGSTCQSDFVVKENGQDLSFEAQAKITQKPGEQIFVELAIDMSKSTANQLPQIIGGAKDFVSTLQTQRGVGVQIGIQLFAGDANLLEWQKATLDTPTLLARLDALLTTNPLQDFSSTNINGAMIQALSKLASAEQAFNARNFGGALSTGYVVLFTGGRDTSGRKLLSDVMAAEAKSRDQVIAVGFPGPDFNAAAQNALCAIATVNPSIAPSNSTACAEPNAALIAPTQDQLEREFKAVAYRIAGQERRTYLLSYCSPARAGMPIVTVSIASATNSSSEPASFPFLAASFGPGCSAATLANACADKQCGGLVCGACDDRTTSCSDTTSQCVSFCVQRNACGGTAITNANGYLQTCNDSPESTSCENQCVDLTSNPSHCGTCTNVCANGASCSHSLCECPGTEAACYGTCTDLTSNTSHCGQCANACVAGASCINSACFCPPSQAICSGMCTDTRSDPRNCGRCGVACQSGYDCSGQACVPQQEWTQWQPPLDAPANYTDNLDGTVADHTTGLVWQQGNGSASSFKDAVTYCASLPLAGGAWRVPSRIELVSIIDYTRYYPTLSYIYFPGAPEGVFWTSSVYQADSTGGTRWGVDFGTGQAGGVLDGTGVRCVR